jgi:hypothetical protein
MTQKKNGALEFLTLQAPYRADCTYIFAAGHKGCRGATDPSREVAR